MIIVIDFGSQYTQLISRRVRELGVNSRIVPYDRSISKKGTITGIILAGSPSSSRGQFYRKPSKEIFDMGVPILGICYGMQVIARMLGGKVEKGITREYGDTRAEIETDNELFKGLPKKMRVWMSHYDRIVKMPSGFKSIAKTGSVDIAAMADSGRKYYGLQFHPEVVHTQNGNKILSNFLFNICKAKKDWSLKNWIDNKIDEIREEVGKGKVVMALSGGVDSSVTSVLVQKAVNDRFHPIFVDHGMMRYKDEKRIRDILMKKMGLKVSIINKQDKFLTELKGITDPEEKRKIIGKEFIDTFTNEARKIKGATHLAQGTIYPDVIESAKTGTGASKIKSHHNVGGLPEKLELKLLEPLNLLYKDEVREIGKRLGLPKEIIKQHPFPGPGLGIRIMGEVTKDRAEMLRKAGEILDKELKKAGIYYDLWQAFCVFVPVRTVGVMGDMRTYENLIAIRCVQSKDAMTANWADIPYPVMGKISTRIVNEVDGINRVVYDVTNKPPGTIEWE